MPQHRLSISDKESLWSKEYLYGFYSKADTPWEWHKPNMDSCKN